MNLFNFIKNRLSILDVIGEYTTLKKAGLYWKSCCPFHHEKTASFTVSPHKEIFYCFGCHMGGDVISFIAKIEHCSPLEAARHLIERYNIEVPAEYAEHKPEQSQENKKQYVELCNLVAQWAHYNLSKTDSALSYLVHRNISNKSIKDFKIGYFPPGQAALKNLLQYVQKNGFLAKDLIEIKIILDGKNGLYSPFEDRIIFPIKDNLGRMCGFGGRIFKKQDDRAKYYNSHEHLFFNKSQLLFGLDQAKKSIQEQGKAFLVEGYTDLIAMAQAGFTNTVATLGTACTQEHLKQLARYTDRLYIIYDGDPAGQKAITRLTELCWQANIDLFIITLPSQEDPDSFLAKNGNLLELISQAQDIFSFFIESSTNQFESKSLQDRLQIIKKLLDIIIKVSDQLKQDLLLQKIAQRCAISLDTLKQQMGIVQVKNKQQAPAVSLENTTPVVENHKIHDNQITQLEKKLFSAILFGEINLSSEDEELVNKWLHPELLFFLDKLKNIQTQHNHIQGKAVFDMLEFKDKELLSKFIIEADEDNNPKEHILLQFYKKHWKSMVLEVRQKIEQSSRASDGALVHTLLSELESYKKKMLRRGIT
jgi:DNA primase